MRRLILIVLCVMLAVPVSGQAEFRRAVPTVEMHRAEQLRRATPEFINYMLDNGRSEDCIYPVAPKDGYISLALCMFEDRYEDVKTLYIVASGRHILLFCKNDLVAFAPSWFPYDSAQLAMVDIPPCKYTVMLHENGDSGYEPLAYEFTVSVKEGQEGVKDGTVQSQ